ncbi:aa3-type cytochrome c oxidase subunit IV [Pseudogemmobacter sp. W21_MBD1_M6]
MAEYKHGSMDTTTQEKTFEGFISMTTKAVVIIIATLIFMAIFNS